MQVELGWNERWGDEKNWPEGEGWSGWRVKRLAQQVGWWFGSAKKKASSANGTRGPLADLQGIKCKRDSALKKTKKLRKSGGHIS